MHPRIRIVLKVMDQQYHRNARKVDIGGVSARHEGAASRRRFARDGREAELGTDIQWQESFVSRDRTCVYIAQNETIIREHAERSGFPADHIHEIVAGINPTTAEPRPEMSSAG